MEENKKNIFSMARSEKMLPQEEMLEVRNEEKSISIGIPKEITFQENRIALVPNAVQQLVQNGHKVIIEAEAGKAANFTDKDYSEAGGQIVHDVKEVFQSEIILKVASPTLQEIDMLTYNQTIFSSLQLPVQKKEYFTKLQSKRATAICFEFIKDRSNISSVRRSMSEIAGQTAIVIAAEYLANIKFSKGSMLGGFSGINPTEVVIIGAGTVGEYAARIALAFGAQVKVFDNSIYKLRSLQDKLGARIFTSIIQPKLLLKALRTAHVAIGCVYSPEGKAPCIVTEEMVSQMKRGAIIIDVSIDQGGCFETSHVTSHADPIFIKYNVVHYCVPNIASRVPHTASFAFSNIFVPMLLKSGQEGGIDNLLKTDPGVRQGVYIYKGVLTSNCISKQFDLPCQDIDLLMAAYLR